MRTNLSAQKDCSPVRYWMPRCGQVGWLCRHQGRVYAHGHAHTHHRLCATPRARPAWLAALPAVPSVETWAPCPLRAASHWRWRRSGQCELGWQLRYGVDPQQPWRPPAHRQAPRFAQLGQQSGFVGGMRQFSRVSEAAKSMGRAWVLPWHVEQRQRVTRVAHRHQSGLQWTLVALVQVVHDLPLPLPASLS